MRARLLFLAGVGVFDRLVADLVLDGLVIDDVAAADGLVLILLVDDLLVLLIFVPLVEIWAVLGASVVIAVVFVAFLMHLLLDVASLAADEWWELFLLVVDLSAALFDPSASFAAAAARPRQHFEQSGLFLGLAVNFLRRIAAPIEFLVFHPVALTPAQHPRLLGERRAVVVVVTFFLGLLLGLAGLLMVRSRLAFGGIASLLLVLRALLLPLLLASLRPDLVVDVVRLLSARLLVVALVVILR